jgi:hypothetical protein
MPLYAYSTEPSGRLPSSRNIGEPERSSPLSQERATGPYAEADDPERGESKSKSAHPQVRAPQLRSSTVIGEMSEGKRVAYEGSKHLK